MPKGVTAGRLVNAGGAHGFLHGLLQRAFINMMPPLFAGTRIDGKARGGKGILPAPLAGSARIFSVKRVRQPDFAETISQIPVCCALIFSKCRCNGAARFTGSIVMRSRPPLVSRTVICA